MFPKYFGTEQICCTENMTWYTDYSIPNTESKVQYMQWYPGVLAQIEL